MKSKKISENKKNFIEKKRILLHEKKELSNNYSIIEQLQQSVDILSKNMFDSNQNDNIQMINDFINYKNNQNKELEKNINNIITDIENTRNNVENILIDTKNKERLIRKNNLIKEFDKVEKISKKINEDIRQLTSLKQMMDLELNNQSLNIDNLYVEIPDREDSSWEIEDFLNDKQTRFEALEEVASGTLEIFDTMNKPKLSVFDYAHASSSAFTVALNVATISTLLAIEAIKRKFKNN